MLVNVLLTFSGAIFVVALLDLVLSDVQKRKINDRVSATWIWLDDAKKHFFKSSIAIRVLNYFKRNKELLQLDLTTIGVLFGLGTFVMIGLVIFVKMTEDNEWLIQGMWFQLTIMALDTILRILALVTFLTFLPVLLLYLCAALLWTAEKITLRIAEHPKGVAAISAVMGSFLGFLKALV